jgi:hypothetical protein
MRTAIILLASAFALAGCNREPSIDVKDANASEVAEAMRKSGVAEGDTMFEPGKWSSTVKVEEMSMPGMPPEMQSRMKQVMADRAEHQFEICLTPEDAKRPSEDFFAGKDNGCKYDHFTMGDGKIDAKMRCERQGMTQTTEMSGTYSREAYSMRMSSKAEGGQEGGMTMRMRMDSKRIGKCDGKEKA